jgi:geranylgeranyl pyrophosphate synthase
LGGRAEDALSAVGIEMLQRFLVHDDIEDGSESRRGVATMHAVPDAYCHQQHWRR